MAHTLTWATFETSPMEPYGDPADGAYRLDLAQTVHLSNAMAERLREVVNDVDAATCQANTCTAAIGYVLWEDDEGRGGTSWHWTTIVAAPEGTVKAVCEDCCPETVYEIP